MKEFTGICVCGHSFEDHHHGMIMQPQLMIDRGDDFRNIDGILGQECEATQFEGMFTPDVTVTHEDGRIEKKHYDKECECNSYWDKGWGERK
jgi:hypothetical protein